MRDFTRSGRAAKAPKPGQLTPEQLAVIAAALAELAGRVDQVRHHLSVLDAAIQASPGSTSRSMRDRRSSTRSRSS
jgi:hypothetical protein